MRRDIAAECVIATAFIGILAAVAHLGNARVKTCGATHSIRLHHSDGTPQRLDVSELSAGGKRWLPSQARMGHNLRALFDTRNTSTLTLVGTASFFHATLGTRQNSTTYHCAKRSTPMKLEM